MSVIVKINKSDVSRLKTVMKKAPDTTTALLERAVLAAKFVLEKNTLKNEPVPYRTGFLLSSFRTPGSWTNPFMGSRMIARYMPTVHYAGYVDDPKYNRSGSANYMKKIEKKSRKEINTLFNKAADKAAADIAKI